MLWRTACRDPRKGWDAEGFLPVGRPMWHPAIQNRWIPEKPLRIRVRDALISDAPQILGVTDRGYALLHPPLGTQG